PTGPTGGQCGELSGAPRGICVAYCVALDCDVDPRFRVACRVLHRLFERFTGDDTLPCERPTLQPTSCDDMGGKTGKMCAKICERCEERGFPSSCTRLARRFTQHTGLELPCAR
ncbi:MAG: hypothetical protein SF182_09135, partial [Deltaproteobacteria bacterium]|nr:hypothetical protein [Deltaproteobacteria bacterium]